MPEYGSRSALIGLVLAPGIYPGAALELTVAVYGCHRVAVAGQQRLGGAHGGAERHLAFGNPVLAVELLLFGAVIFFRPAGAEGTLIHRPAGPEHLAGGELRRPEGTRHKAVTAADAGLLADQHDAVLPLIEGIHRADRDAGRIRAMHTGGGKRFFPRLALINGEYLSTVDAHGDMIALFTGNHAAAAVDTSFDIA
jgi:hypothetical protein